MDSFNEQTKICYCHRRSEVDTAMTKNAGISKLGRATPKAALKCKGHVAMRTAS